MWVDKHRQFVTQRQLPALATVTVALTDEALVLSHPNVSPCYVPLAEPESNVYDVSVWGDACQAFLESDDVSRWLTAALGQDAEGPNLLDVVPPSRYTLLPNTAGCYTAKDAVRTCRLARELLGGHTLVKLEVLGDERTRPVGLFGSIDRDQDMLAHR